MPLSRPSSALGPPIHRPSRRRTGVERRPDEPHGEGARIRETLAHFGIGVKVARIQEGPVVTQYALDVEPGIKLSRIEGQGQPGIRPRGSQHPDRGSDPR